MGEEGLFHGIAVLIDDEINNPKASVAGLKKQIEDAGCHVVPLSTMPKSESVANFREVAFFVVDWNLNGAELQKEGVEATITSNLLEQQNEDSIVGFLQELKKVRFAPVFIFTNESVDFVQGRLQEHKDLYDANDPSHILVMDKQKVIDAGLFTVLGDWMDNAPSVYLLKSWERAYERAKNELFLDFYTKSTLWPLVIWKSIEMDEEPPAAALGELIGRNLISRIPPLDCDLSPFLQQLEDKKKDLSEYEAMVRKVLEGERFLPNSRLDQNSVAPGDVFFVGQDYFLNLRPDCDCIARGHDSLDRVALYLLKGSAQDIATTPFDRTFGLITEKDNEAIAFPIHDGKIVCFKFRTLLQKKWRDVKTNRLGRLLPPYLTRLQQRYSAYLQRPGLARLPNELFPEAGSAAARDHETDAPNAPAIESAPVEDTREPKADASSAPAPNK